VWGARRYDELLTIIKQISFLIVKKKMYSHILTLIFPDCLTNVISVYAGYPYIEELERRSRLQHAYSETGYMNLLNAPKGDYYFRSHSTNDYYKRFFTIRGTLSNSMFVEPVIFHKSNSCNSLIVVNFDKCENTTITEFTIRGFKKVYITTESFPKDCHYLFVPKKLKQQASLYRIINAFKYEIGPY
jgi:hypothetical protein